MADRFGRTVASNGYVLIRVGRNHHLADVRGYAYEHRLVAEKILGRRLQPGEVVHHRDHNKVNNNPANLEIVTRAQHGVEHRRRDSRRRMPGEPNPIVSCECGCGSTFERYDSGKRPRQYVSGHNGKERRDERVRVTNQREMTERDHGRNEYGGRTNHG